jgi:hypothetical protein
MGWIDLSQQRDSLRAVVKKLTLPFSFQKMLEISSVPEEL